MASIAIPGALILAGVLFPRSVEGKSFPGFVVILFFCVLVILLAVTGFVGTREHSVDDCDKEDLKQAKRIHISCLAISGTLAGGLLGAALNVGVSSLLKKWFAAAGLSLGSRSMSF